MDDFDQEGINEELDFAIRESIQDAHKLPYSMQTNRRQTNSDDFMKIMAAIHKVDVYALQELSGCVSAFRERSSRGWLPLHAASVQQHAEILYVVLQALASTNVTLEEQTEDGDTSLTLAAEADLVENVRMLLQHGASPNNTNSRNESPLLIGDTQTHADP